MRHLYDSSMASIRSEIRRLADRAAAASPPASTPVRAEIDALRRSLEPLIDGFRHSAIGITGVFDRDRSQAIAALLAHEVVARERLTTTIARVTREDVILGQDEADGGTDGRGAWQRPPRPHALNIWPSARREEGVRFEVGQLELLHWLRAENELTIVAFDDLGGVFNRLPLARRLDGLIVVNSGRDADLDLMGSAMGILERERVRILGQIRNVAEREDPPEPGPSVDD